MFLFKQSVLHCSNIWWLEGHGTHFNSASLCKRIQSVLVKSVNTLTGACCYPMVLFEYCFYISQKHVYVCNLCTLPFFCFLYTQVFIKQQTNDVYQLARHWKTFCAFMYVVFLVILFLDFGFSGCYTAHNMVVLFDHLPFCLHYCSFWSGLVTCFLTFNILNVNSLHISFYVLMYFLLRAQFTWAGLLPNNLNNLFKYKNNH